jgi:anti-anti-sigma regulatory factor
MVLATSGMSDPVSLLVAVVEGRAEFRIFGPATFAQAPAFRSAVEALRGRGHQRFVVDLGGCPTMDSTFIGVLAGLARKLKGPEGVELVNAGERIQLQIGNLGITAFFAWRQRAAAPGAAFQTVAAPAAGKATLSRVALEAHRDLMAANPENVARFQEVAEFLAQEVKSAGA